jgi:regulator of sirC expression with transglutaminase-like and TPR domain
MIPRTLLDAESALKVCANMPLDRFDLTACALACAIHENPDRDLSEALGVLDQLTALAQQRKPQSALALSQLIFGEMGFAGSTKDFDDPGNADLIRILEARAGLPVGLGVIWRHVARLSNTPLYGVDSPGHFLLRLEASDGPIFIDPLAGGAIVDEVGLSEIANRVGIKALSDAMLAPVSDRVMAVRLQTNLASRARASGQTEGWMRAAFRRALLAPDNYQVALDYSQAAEAAGQIHIALEWAQRASQLQGYTQADRDRTQTLRQKLN